ncbi:MAG: O-antigen ligase family protein [Candidatus Hodarchaeota archaeon]
MNCSGLLIAFLAAGIFTQLPLNIYFILVGGIASLILIYYRLEWGIGFFIASMLYEKQLLIGEISLTRLVGLPILLICIIKILLRQKKIYFNKITDSIILTLFLWMCLSVFYAKNVNLVRESLLTYLQLIVSYIIIKSVVDNEIELQKLIKVVIFFSIGIVVFSMIKFISNQDMLLIDIYHSNHRIIGPSDDPNKLALGLIFILPLSIYMFIKENKIYLIPVAIFSFIILCTFSRGGIIGMVVASVLSVMELNRNFKKGLVYSLIFILILTGSFMAINKGNKMLNRIKSIQNLEDGSIKVRRDMVITAIDMAIKNPLTGVGLNNFMENSHLYGNRIHYRRASHNGYLDVLAKLGLPGFLLLLGLLYFTYKNFLIYENYANKNNLQDNLIMVRFIKISFIAYLVSAFFLSLLANKLFWVLLAFSNILFKSYQNKERYKNTRSISD